MFSDPIIFISTDSCGSRPELKLLPSMCYITYWPITPKFWVKVSYRKIWKIMNFWKIAHFLAYYFRNISMFSDPIIFISTDSRGSRPERKLLPNMCYITHWSITPKIWVKVAYNTHVFENSIRPYVCHVKKSWNRWARISDACLVVILDSGFISSCNEKCTMDSEALSLDSGFASSYSRKSRNGFRIMDSDSGFAFSCSEKCRMDSDSGFGFWIPDSLTRVAEKVEMDSDSDSLLVEAVLG